MPRGPRFLTGLADGPFPAGKTAVPNVAGLSWSLDTSRTGFDKQLLGEEVQLDTEELLSSAGLTTGKSEASRDPIASSD